MSNPSHDNVRVMNTKPRVVLEPELEIQVVNMDSIGRRRLAKVYFRWAMQLFVSSRILERHELRGKVLRLELPPRS